MNSTLIKLYGFFAGVSLLAFLLTGHLANAQETEPGLTQKQQTRALNLALNMSSRAEAMGERFERLINKIRGNQEWMKTDRNQDFPEVDAHMAAASEMLQRNYAIYETLYDETYQTFTSQDPKAGWPAVRRKYVAMQENLTIAHQHLADSLFILKEADRLWQTGARTSTASTSVNNASSTN